ncbi:imelysin family protein [Eleftheria terrae]|uniref:imelysin family protein n=1 Tax=Eleftheria terrae TaxID=1597781 RepID=UPI00263AFD6E|nr:imelysin family protein [Eleftheria terrae]WKB52454.1 imelysin family protein [Eleftheria terrae]
MRALLTAAALAVLGTTLPNAALAQAARPIVAVPYYTAVSFMQGLNEHWYAPRSEEFARQSAQLQPAVHALCEAAPNAAPAALQTARARWRDSALAWDRLSGVAAGALLARRSARQIDFTPTRPELIEKAIARAPEGAAGMERIGTPAKGLPALEWLLWQSRLAPATPACRYAEEVAADIAREADALARAYREAVATPDEAEQASAAMAEVVNQWVGGIERLRWQDLERPVRSAGQGGRQAAQFPRALSGATRQSWQARWEAVATLSAAPSGSTAPQPGKGLVPIETYLRGRGLNDVADRLAAGVGQADQALRQAGPQAPAGVLAAARTLGALKRLAEGSAAPALEVSIGFSDADGD